MGIRDLRRALALWASHSRPSQVLATLGRPQESAAWWLSATVQWAEGRSDAAWSEGLETDLKAIPFWARGRVRRLLKASVGATAGTVQESEAFLLRWADHSARVRHRIALQRHRRGDHPQAWELLRDTLSFATEDPLLLEDILRTALGDLHASDRTEPLSDQAQGLLRHLIQASLALLTQRHGDPRIPWDRTAPALHLLQEGDPLGALCLIRPVPPDLRTQAHWEVEALVLRALGQPELARTSVISGLEAHPTSFRLWIERHHLDLAAGQAEAAREALDMAARCLPPFAAQPGPTWEWRLRRAAFAHFVDRDPDRAWEYLKDLPESAPDDHHPPLRLQVRLALGDHEDTYTKLRPLLECQPNDVDLRLMEADCLAGLGAWDSLSEHLEDLPEAARRRPEFWHLAGIAAAHRQDLGPALEALERAAHMAPEDLRLVLDAGHACMDVADHARAEVHWRQALRIEPRCDEALVHLAETLQLRHDPEGAKRLLRECLIHHPDHPEAQAFLAELEAN